MKRLHWLEKRSATLEPTHPYGRLRTQRVAAAGLRRILRVPEPLEPRCLLATFVVNQVHDLPDFDLGDGVADSDPDMPGVQISLRSAIQNANLDAALDNIFFNIPGAGVKVISPTSALPAITQAVVIDGYTQPTAAANTLGLGSNATILIHLDGLSAGAASGLTLSAGGSTVRGLSITRFQFQGIEIRGPGHFSTIAGNFIGVPPAGNVDQGNTLNGVLIVNSAGNVIGGLSPGDRNVISGNNGSGIALAGTDSINNAIHGNYIGTNAAGNGDLGNTENGVIVSELTTGGGIASHTFIGGAFPGAGNVISGNDGSGVTLLGADAQFNEIQGNRIGTNAAGTAALGNGFHGVLISFFDSLAASNNTIGGVPDPVSSPMPRNIISGNGRAGVAMFGAGATGNKVQGNYIGTDVTGTLAIPNANDGVRLGDNSLGAGPSGNFIGGTTPGAGNLISGNMDNGIELAGATTMNNAIEGNLIGPDAEGMSTLVDDQGNDRGNDRGIFIDRAPGNRIGGATAAARNVISGNNQVGIRIDGDTATDNLVQGNYIGTAIDGTSAVPNGGTGVLITNAASRNVVGAPFTSDDPLLGNIVAFNGTDGVAVLGGTRNTVRLNSIHHNVQLGIDLEGEEDTLNDPDDSDTGPNNLQNWPELIRLDQTGSTATVYFESEPNRAYKFDFYANFGSSATMLGEGQQYLATRLTALGLDGYLESEFSLPLASPLGRFVTVTATDALGNTSEFSHDADMDGLYDNWESGVAIDGNNDGIGDFTLLLANPLHKDLYVEVDAMTGRDPAPATLARVVSAFAAAPNSLVNNPDGLDGVTLHADLDETFLTLQDFPFGFVNFILVKTSHFGTFLERGSSNAENLLAAKRKAYRYCIFANTYHFGTSSGLAELAGNDFMVTLGGWSTPGGTPEQQAGTFMHELGHTLGLKHGGDQEFFANHKPNYYSVMNYLWQMPDSLYNPLGLLDFSRQRLPDLNENSLDETAGIGGPVGVQVPIGPDSDRRLANMNGPVDWSHDDADGDGTHDNDVGVDVDVNNEGVVLTTLTGFEDWSHLEYAFRQNLWFEEGAVYEPDPNDIDLTFEQYQQRHDELLENYSADFDEDNDVDGADFLAWQRGLGIVDGALPSQGDSDADGDVDRVDLVVWQESFGDEAPEAASAAPVEPSLADKIDFSSLAALWPGLDFNRAIPVERTLRPTAVSAEGRAVAFARFSDLRYSNDEDDADLITARGNRVSRLAAHDIAFDEALRPLSDRFESLSGALGRRLSS